MPGLKSAALDARAATDVQLTGAALDARAATDVSLRDLGSETATERPLKPRKLFSTVRVPNAENGVR